jgi:tetratricopeptide (TPR) repeat protein
LLAIAGAATAQAVVIARIQTFRGAVSVRRLAQSLAVGARNFALVGGDRVVTGPTGSARIVAVDGKRATMGPGSDLELNTSARGAAWRNNLGRVVVWITGRGRTEVSSPGAVAAAEGTGFELNVAADGTSVLTVAEGTVTWYNNLGQVSVTADQQSTAVPGQPPTRPVAVDSSGVRIFEATVENLALSLETPQVPGPRAQLAALLTQRAAAAAAAPDAAAQVALGDVQLDLGRAEEALAAYQRAQALAPGDARAAGRVSLAALRLGRSDLARTGAETAERLAPGGVEGALARGRLQLAEGNAAAAVPLLTAAAQASPQSAQAPTLLGLAYLRLRRIPEAEAALRDAIRREPQLFSPQAYLSSALLLENRLPEGEAAARQALALAPDSALAHEAVGNTLLFTGRAPAAVAELRRAVEIDPLSGEARAQLARALAASDQPVEAAAEASHAVALDPENAGARTTLGVLFSANRDRDRAAREFREAIRVAPQLASARTGLSGVEIQRGRFSQALKAQAGALDLDTGSPQAFNNLGVIHTARGGLGEALKDFREAIRLQPAYGLPHANLALAHLELNQFEEALREGQEALRLGERSAPLHTTLARVYLKLNRFDRALAELRRAQALDPDYPLQYFHLAQLFRLEGRERDGVRALLRGLALDPGTAVEQRQYARTETTQAGGDTARHHDLKTDGRAEVGRLSYFVSGSEDARDANRPNSDLRDRAGEGILGYQPNGRQVLALFAAGLDERGGRPGQVLAGGLSQAAGFRRDLTVNDWHLLSRTAIGPRAHLTLDGGYRRAGVFARNPDADTGDFFVRSFASVERTMFGDADWERDLGKRSTARVGGSWSESRRTFDGLFPGLDPGDTLPVTTGERPTLLTGWAELRRQFGRRMDLTLGVQGGQTSHSAGLARPKVSAHYYGRGGASVALLVYPTFQQQTADLLPVETWAQPFEAVAADQFEGGLLMNYELGWELPLRRQSLLSGVLFHRTGDGLLVGTVDPELAPLVTRFPIVEGQISGAQLAYEHGFGVSLTSRLFARYTQTHDQETGGELPYFPRLQGGWRLDYVNRAGFAAQLGATIIGSRRDITDLNDPGRTLAGFVTADARVSWQQTLRRSYFLQVTDLFDHGPAFYRGFPGAGRTIFGGIQLRL